jgi:hypothetical protein
MSTAIDGDLEDDAPARSPMRRDGRIIAMPAEPIPAEVNDAFLADLAFERTLSVARGLASGFQRVHRAARQRPFRCRGALCTRPTPPRLSWPSLPPTIDHQPKGSRMNASQIQSTPWPVLAFNPAHAPPP